MNKILLGLLDVFLADISLIKHNDPQGGAIKAKEKMQELCAKHSFFGNNFCPKALILNPQVEDVKCLLTTEEIESSKLVIHTRMKKYPAFNKQKQ